MLNAAITIMGSGRLGPTLVAVLGLVAAVLGARSLAGARRRGAQSGPVQGRRPSAVVLRVGAVLLGGTFIAVADGGPGTGNGVVASAAAIALGLLAIGLDRFAAVQRAR